MILMLSSREFLESPTYLPPPASLVERRPSSIIYDNDPPVINELKREESPKDAKLKKSAIEISSEDSDSSKNGSSLHTSV